MHLYSTLIVLCMTYCILDALPATHRLGIELGIDPITKLDVLEILKYWNYPGEAHSVITRDGYNLTVHRIPHGRNVSATKGVVYLQHGLICSSADFLLNLPNESLGFMLADRGYDVWMGNVRGNFYSRSHVTLKPTDAKFWEFSWDEHSLIDLPAMLEYVLNYTGQTQLKYVGHSQGTLMGFIGFSVNQPLASKIKVFAAMAPVLYVGHAKGLVRFLADNYLDLDLIARLFGINEFLPSGKLTYDTAMIFCGKEDAFICEYVMFAIFGPDQSGFNKSRLTVYVSHTPAGTSLQNMLHWGQGILKNDISHFDYGKKKNMEIYHQPNPPAYAPPYSLQVPIALYHGGEDWLVQQDDYERLLKILKIVHQKKLDKFDHLDFLWGLQAAKKVYSDIIELFEKY